MKSKIVKKFESFSNSIDSYLEESTFDDLPFNFKKGLLTWMVEGDPVDWTFEEPINDWLNDDNIQVAINDYSREKGNFIFKYGFVPTKLIIERITPSILDYGYGSFEEWREAYQSTNDANHTELFPILVDDDDVEYIVDGWHRFNFYLSKSIDTIPLIKI